jgi:RNA polymerase sigma-70 factor (ECF subfamily)
LIFEQDAVLLKGVKAGKERYFNQLVFKYKDKIYNTAYRFLADYQEAQDITQECFFAVHKNIRKFREESSLSTWIFTITVNLCRNRLKSAAYKRQTRTVSIIEKALDGKNDRENPAAFIEKKEFEARIQAELERLTPDMKEIVILRDIEQLSYEEISKILNIDLGTVKSRLHRARVELREALKGVI